MSDTEIPTEELRFHPSSFRDPSGRLFWWKDELYRGIAPLREVLYQKLFQDGTVEVLISKGLIVETALVPFHTHSYPLVLKHRCLPFVSYPYEWCGAMLKDAALLLLDLELELLKYGLTLHDAYPWNIVFDGPRPVNVDFGSIALHEGDSPWLASEMFSRFFLNPLRLMCAGHHRIARWLLHDFDTGVLPGDVSALTDSWQSRALTSLMSGLRRCLWESRRIAPPSVRQAVWRRLEAFQSRRRQVQPRKLPAEIAAARGVFLSRLRNQVEGLTPLLPKSRCLDGDSSLSAPGPSVEGNAKHVGVQRVLTELQPASLLAIASDHGWYSQTAASLGINAIAIDADETRVTQLYFEAKDRRLRILPLVLDFRRPSPGYGVCNEWLAPAARRLQCEMVVALGGVHHLVLQEQMRFEQIATGLAAFGNKGLLVEFAPATDPSVKVCRPAEFARYTLPAFRDALRLHFPRITPIPSFPEGRTLLVCER